MSSIEIFFNFISYIKRAFVNNISFSEDFEEHLNSLSEKGWLTKTDNGYKLHQIIKEYIFINYPPNHIEEHNVMSSILIQMDANHNFFSLKDSNYTLKNNLIYIESMLSFLVKIRRQNKDTAIYYNALGGIYDTQGL